MSFVKSASTRTPVSNSRVELEKLLRRYGCSSFAVQTDYEGGRARVSFMVPDTPTKGATKIPVQLEVQTHAVYDALFGQPLMRGTRPDGTWGPMFNPKGYVPEKLAQAERVAWRQLILWVDAALSAASAGLQKVSEAFLAHTLVRGDDGRVRRFSEHMDHLSGGDWRALLPPAPTVEDA